MKHAAPTPRRVRPAFLAAAAVAFAVAIPSVVNAAGTTITRADAQAAADTIAAYLAQPEPTLTVTEAGPTVTVTASPTTSPSGPGPSSTPTSSPSASATSTPTPSGTVVASPFIAPTLNNPVTIQIAASGGTYSAPSTVDCIFVAPQIITGNVTLNGCDDRVLIGAVFGGRTTTAGFTDTGNRGIRLYDTTSSQTGTDYLEGLWFKPGSYLSDAIQGAYRTTTNRTLIVQNVLVDSTTYGSKTAVHADTLQLWGGPQNFHVNGLTATDARYQGIFMANDVNNARGAYTFARINLVGSSPSYCFTDLSRSRHDITASEVYCSGFAHVGTNDGYSNAPAGVRSGTVADYVPASLWLGGTYVG